MLDTTRFQLFIGADGDDSKDGLSRANRIQTQHRLNQIMAANAANGKPYQLCLEGNFDHDWMALSGNNLGFCFNFNIAGYGNDKTAPWQNVTGLRLSATAIVTPPGPGEPAIPLPLLCDYKRFTVASALTEVATNIWQLPGVVASSANRARRVFACDYEALDDDDFKYHEIWESGGTGPNDFYNNLGSAPGYDWTQCDATGTLTASLFIYCTENPIDRFGALTVATDETGTLLRFETDGWIVDPELTLQGGGANVMQIAGCHGALFEAAIRGWHFYTGAIYIFQNTLYGGDPDKDNQDIVISPCIDAAVVGLPFYSADNDGHQMGGHEGIGISNLAGLNGLRIQGIASNGRPSRIDDLLHAGIATTCDPAGKLITNLLVEPGISFDFTNVIYGRAFSLLGQATTLRNVRVEGGLITNQPTSSEFGGRDIKIAGATFLAGKLDGGAIMSNIFSDKAHAELTWRFGSSTGTPSNNTYDTSNAVSVFTDSKTDANVDVYNVTISNCVFNGYYSGGLNFATTAATETFQGAVVVSGCTFIAPAGPNATIAGLPTATTYAVEHTFATAYPEKAMRYFNNTAVGYTNARRFVNTQPFNNTVGLTSTDFLPLTQNMGWRFIDTWAIGVGNPYTVTDRY